MGLETVVESSKGEEMVTESKPEEARKLIDEARAIVDIHPSMPSLREKRSMQNIQAKLSELSNALEAALAELTGSDEAEKWLESQPGWGPRQPYTKAGKSIVQALHQYGQAALAENRVLRDSVEAKGNSVDYVIRNAQRQAAAEAQVASLREAGQQMARWVAFNAGSEADHLLRSWERALSGASQDDEGRKPPK